MQHHAQLIFVLLIEMGFCRVAEVGLELLNSSNMSMLAFQSAGITGVSHHAWTDGHMTLKDRFTLYNPTLVSSPTPL